MPLRVPSPCIPANPPVPADTVYWPVYAPVVRLPAPVNVVTSVPVYEVCPGNPPMVPANMQVPWKVNELSGYTTTTSAPLHVPTDDPLSTWSDVYAMNV